MVCSERIPPRIEGAFVSAYNGGRPAGCDLSEGGSPKYDSSCDRCGEDLRFRSCGDGLGICMRVVTEVFRTHRTTPSPFSTRELARVQRAREEVGKSANGGTNDFSEQENYS